MISKKSYKDMNMLVDILSDIKSNKPNEVTQELEELENKLIELKSDLVMYSTMLSTIDNEVTSFIESLYKNDPEFQEEEFDKFKVQRTSRSRLVWERDIPEFMRVKTERDIPAVRKYFKKNHRFPDGITEEFDYSFKISPSKNNEN